MKGQEIMANALTTGANPLEASPFAVSWQKLLMWIFIITDGLLFAVVVIGFSVQLLLESG